MDEFHDEFRNVHIKNEHIVLSSYPEVQFLGPNAVFEDSRIDVDVSARGWSIVEARFINCTIRAKRQQTYFPFDSAYFERCQLKGRFAGCEFGRRIDDDPEDPLYWSEAGIVDTDLSAARLDGCRFMNCDLSTLRLPLWPCFTICNPKQARKQAEQLPWPGIMRILPGTWRDEPEGSVAITYDARTFCKKDGVTEEELKAVLAQLPGVIM
jgi:hypothetical protein